MADIDVFDPNMLAFVDETGFDGRNLIRQFGYGLRRITPVTHQLLVYGQCISAIGVMTTRGIEEFYLVEGSVNDSLILYRDACSTSCCPLMVTIPGQY